MIEQLRIKGFKNFQDVELHLGPWNLFIGANSSGKSNLFEALRIFQGIALQYRVEEVFNGKPKNARGDVWDGMRGGLANAGFFNQDLVSLGISGTEHGAPYSYDFTVSTLRGTIEAERLVLDGVEFPRGEGLDKGEFGLLSELEPSMLLTGFIDTVKLDLSPAILRDYSPAGRVWQLGEHGENFAAVVKAILEDPTAASAYRSWLEELTPREFDRILTLPGAVGDSLFAMEHHGRVFPAHVLSDGTLRFAALTAVFFQPSPPSYLILEEIENGIHASRVRLLVEMLRQLSSSTRPQVFASTHSPVILDWLTDEDLAHTFLCTVDEDTGASTVRSLASIPRLRELIKDHATGDLFAEGWMETVV